MLSDSACSSTSSPQLDFRLCDGLHKTGFDGKIITFHSVSVGTMRRNVTEHPARSYTKASMIYSGAQGREVEDDDGHRRAPAVGRIDQTRLRRPREAPIRVSRKISIFEGENWPNPSPFCAYFWAHITPCFPAISIFVPDLGPVRSMLVYGIYRFFFGVATFSSLSFLA